MSHTMHRRSTSGLSEHRPLDSSSGSIGITRRGKYTEVPRSRASRSSAIAVAHVVADVGDGDHQTEILAGALAVHRVVEVLRGLAVDGHQRQLASDPMRSLRSALLHRRSAAASPGVSPRAENSMRQIVLAQRDLDLHARDRRSCRAPRRPWPAPRGASTAARSISATTTCPGLASPRMSGGIRMSWLMRLFSATRIPDAVILVQAPDDFAIGALQHIDDDAFGPAAPVDADLARRRRDRRAAPCAFPSADRNRSAPPSSGTRKPKPSGWPCTVPVTRSSLATTQSCALAVGHQLTVALHRGEAACERVALGVRRATPQRAREVVGAHRHALLAQLIEDLRSRDGISTVADRGTSPRRAVRAARAALDRRFARQGLFR